MCAPSNIIKQRRQEKKQAAATEEHGLSPTLIKAHADYQSSSPYIAWMFVTLCTASFYIGPLLLFSPFFIYYFHPQAAALMFCTNIFLALHPVSPWLKFRRYCQILYSIFNFHHNMTPKLNAIAKKEQRLSIVAMHPHAIIPLHGFLWAAICDQLLPEMYGYGATTDGALILPVLRHLLQYMSVGSTQKKKILNQMQVHGQNLFILPGGVAEIFLSRRRKHTDESQVQTIYGRRYGLMKLALQTGAVIYPAYVFGASDMLDQLAPVDKVQDKSKQDTKNSFATMMESLSRKLGGGLTLYYGQYYLPIPYNPQLSMVLGNPIYPVANTTEPNVCGEKNTCKRIENPTTEQVEELMDRYTNALQCLFEQYKVEAGYPNDTLKVI